MNVKTKSLSIFSLCLILIFSLCSFPIYAENGETIDDYTWNDTPKDFFSETCATADSIKTGKGGYIRLVDSNYYVILSLHNTFYYNITDGVASTPSLKIALENTDIVPDIQSYSFEITEDMFSDKDNQETVNNEIDNGYILVFSTTDKSSLYKIKITDIENYMKSEEISTDFEVIECNVEYIKDDIGYITGAKITGKTNQALIDATVIPNVEADNITLDNSNFTIIVNTTNDIDVNILLYTLGNFSTSKTVSLTGIDDNNRDIVINEDTEEETTEEEENETPIENIELNVTGLPQKDSIEVGETVTLKLSSNIPAYLVGNNTSSSDLVTELEFTVTENGSYTCTAVTEAGNSQSLTIGVDCFKSENTYGDDTDPWEGDEEDIELVHTGLYDESSISPLVIWGIIVGILSIITLILYKTGLLAKIGGKKNE